MLVGITHLAPCSRHITLKALVEDKLKKIRPKPHSGLDFLDSL